MRFYLKLALPALNRIMYSVPPGIAMLILLALLHVVKSEDSTCPDSEGVCEASFKPIKLNKALVKGDGNLVQGNQNTIVGDNNWICGEAMMIYGLNNIVIGRVLYDMGHGTIVTSGKCSPAQFLHLSRENAEVGITGGVFTGKVYCEDNHGAGKDICIVHGIKGTPKGNGLYIKEHKNMVTGNNNAIFGNENLICGNGAVLLGNNNAAIGEEIRDFGNNNKIYAHKFENASEPICSQDLLKSLQVPAELMSQAALDKKTGSENDYSQPDIENKNTIIQEGNNGRIQGNAMVITGDNNIIRGSNNEIQGNYNRVCGDNTTVQGHHNIIIGSGKDVSQKNGSNTIVNRKLKNYSECKTTEFESLKVRFKGKL